MWYFSIGVEEMAENDLIRIKIAIEDVLELLVHASWRNKVFKIII
jgi:hypothetical protein